jgi:guanylate kinase
MEIDGLSYNFRKEEDMLYEIQNGEFIEAEIIHDQQVSGTSIRAIEVAGSTGLIPINEIEFGGVNNTVKAKPDTIVIALLPPSYDEWLRRLQAREEMHPEEFISRLQTGQSVIRNLEQNPDFKIVINDDLSNCVGAIRRIVEEGIYTEQDHDRGFKIAREILRRIDLELSTH